MSFDISEYQNTIYHDPQRYDDQYWWKKNDIEFWRRIYNKIPGNKILELGSGTGRLAIPLLKEGADYTGIEISKKFCLIYPFSSSLNLQYFIKFSISFW